MYCACLGEITRRGNFLVSAALPPVLVVLLLLATLERTAANILDGFDWLRQETGPQDIAMAFVATHGGNDADLRYYFCAHDFDPKRLLCTTVSFQEIQRTVNSADAAKKVGGTAQTPKVAKPQTIPDFLIALRVGGKVAFITPCRDLCF